MIKTIGQFLTILAASATWCTLAYYAPTGQCIIIAVIGITGIVLEERSKGSGSPAIERADPSEGEE